MSRPLLLYGINERQNLALIFLGETTCPICNSVLTEGQDIFSTTAFLDQTDQLWRYSDAGMHSDCFQRWEQRNLFISKFNAIAESIVWGNGIQHRMQEDGTIVSLRINGF